MYFLIALAMIAAVIVACVLATDTSGAISAPAPLVAAVTAPAR